MLSKRSGEISKFLAKLPDLAGAEHYGKQITAPVWALRSVGNGSVSGKKPTGLKKHNSVWSNTLCFWDFLKKQYVWSTWHVNFSGFSSFFCLWCTCWKPQLFTSRSLRHVAAVAVVCGPRSPVTPSQSLQLLHFDKFLNFINIVIYCLLVMSFWICFVETLS